jgi:hypothetical protein
VKKDRAKVRRKAKERAEGHRPHDWSAMPGETWWKTWVCRKCGSKIRADVVQREERERKFAQTCAQAIVEDVHES